MRQVETWGNNEHFHLKEEVCRIRRALLPDVAVVIHTGRTKRGRLRFDQEAAFAVDIRGQTIHTKTKIYRAETPSQSTVTHYKTFKID